MTASSIADTMHLFTDPRSRYGALVIEFIRDYFPDSKWIWCQHTLRSPYCLGDADSLPPADRCLSLRDDDEFRTRLQALHSHICKVGGGGVQQGDAMLVEPLLRGLVAAWSRDTHQRGDAALEVMIKQIFMVADGLFSIPPWHETPIDIDHR